MGLTRRFTFLTAFAFVLTSCGSNEDLADPAREEAVPVDTASVDVPDTEPVIAPGEVATGLVEIDGTQLSYAVSVPDGFAVGDTAPLLLAFPPGGQDLELAAGVLASTYKSEADRLGWVVVSPAAPPDGTRFFDGSELLVPGFLDWVETWVTPESGAPHVIGPSNGGISSFRYAIANPDRAQSVVVFPGFPRGDADREALSNIGGLPIRLYAGETDEVWVANAQQTLDSLEALGADVELTVFDGEGHVPRSTSDGVLLFEQLESFRRAS